MRLASGSNFLRGDVGAGRKGEARVSRSLSDAAHVVGVGVQCCVPDTEHLSLLKWQMWSEEDALLWAAQSKMLLPVISMFTKQAGTTSSRSLPRMRNGPRLALAPPLPYPRIDADCGFFTTRAAPGTAILVSITTFPSCPSTYLTSH